MNSKIKIPAEAFLPVPQGTKIKYQHYYKRLVKQNVIFGKSHSEVLLSPPILIGTDAWLVNALTGDMIPDAYACSLVNPKDTPNKKLGRLKAHNRCIKAYHNANSQ